MATESLKTNTALPRVMHIRFLEIIQGDLQCLLKNSSNAEYLSHNTTMLRGFISNLALAYSDQGCDDFLPLLTEFQDAFWNISKKETTEKVALLTQMEKRVCESLSALKAECAGCDQPDPLGR